MNRDIFEFVLDLFEGSVSEARNGSDNFHLSSVKLRPEEPVRLPELSDHPNLKRKKILADLAGKSIHLLEDL